MFIPTCHFTQSLPGTLLHYILHWRMKYTWVLTFTAKDWSTLWSTVSSCTGGIIKCTGYPVGSTHSSRKILFMRIYYTWHLKGRADSNFNWWNLSSSQAWILQCVLRVDFVKISYCGSSGAQPRKVLWIDAQKSNSDLIQSFCTFLLWVMLMMMVVKGVAV